MAHMPLSPPALRDLHPPSRSSAALLGRLSPMVMVCPLAKLGRTSPSIDSGYHLSARGGPTLNHGYQLRGTPTLDHGYQLHMRGSPSVEPSYQYSRGSPSMDQVYGLRGSPSLDQTYHMMGHASPSMDCGYQLRSSPALRRASSPTIDHLQCYRQSPSLDQSYTNHHKLGRSSPSLDQGYHTLVSPSPGPSTPGPWIDPHPVIMQSPGSPSGVTLFKGKKLNSKSSPFDRIADDSMLKIFSWLDSTDLCSCARVCRRWENLSWEPSLWRSIKLNGENLCGDRAVRGVLRRLCGQGRTGACPNVERVLLCDGARLTDKGLTLLARRCPELTHLQLQGCATVTNPALFELATRCTNLQHLDLTGNSRLASLYGRPRYTCFVCTCSAMPNQ